jgi:hypothetical protein
MASARSSAALKPNEAARQIAEAIVAFVTKIPTSHEPLSNTPRERARAIATMSALRASAVSGTLALPPGPAGLVTILPELLAVWHIQARMVADIAGAFGKTGVLSQEQMLYCLFKHSAAQAVRDLVVRVGERYLIRHTNLRAVQATAAKVGVRVTQRAIAKSVTRWLPALGALGVAGYAYFDTAQVAATAIKLFEGEVATA